MEESNYRWIDWWNVYYCSKELQEFKRFKSESNKGVVLYMTVKELKEKLEIIIEDGKEDYTVFVDDFDNGFYEDFEITVIDFFKEIIISVNNYN